MSTGFEVEAASGLMLYHRLAVCWKAGSAWPEEVRAAGARRALPHRGKSWRSIAYPCLEDLGSRVYLGKLCLLKLYRLAQSKN